MLKSDITTLGASRFHMGMQGLHQVSALLIALEKSSTDMENDDVTAAIAGIKSLTAQIGENMDKAMLEGVKHG